MEVVELRKRVEKLQHMRSPITVHLSWMRFLNFIGHHVTNPSLDTTSKMKSIKLGQGPLRSMKQELHSQRM